MNAPLHKHGRFGSFRRGEYLVMSERGADGNLIHAVWELRKRPRYGDGDAFKVAEFVSKIDARAFARTKNQRRFKEP